MKNGSRGQCRFFLIAAASNQFQDFTPIPGPVLEQDRYPVGVVGPLGCTYCPNWNGELFNLALFLRCIPVPMQTLIQ